MFPRRYLVQLELKLVFQVLEKNFQQQKNVDKEYVSVVCIQADWKII